MAATLEVGDQALATRDSLTNAKKRDRERLMPMREVEIPRVSALQVLHDPAVAATLAGRIVWVGVTAHGLSNPILTPAAPRGTAWSSVEWQAQLMHALMQRLGLAYAAIDLVVTPDDELYFLELNESGQFLFVESHTELPITDALATMLAAGSVEFPWAPARATTWFQGELREAAGRRMHAALERHVDPYAQPPVAPLW